ncbi:MAG TPA: hypothetical protein DCF68_22395 [Cyanothece sp. UBA12306]|nr:hypothetical protein [Cyanothece sp. UBA12306]
MMTYTIDLNTIGKITDEQFYQLCRQNPDVKLEKTAQGELIIMSPTGGETGNINSEINAEFVIWNRQYKLGKIFDSSTCFKLTNGSNLSPDVAWIELNRWLKLSKEEREKFPPIVPDFVLELMSRSDSLIKAQKKMEEYQNNGVKLGWLINRQAQTVEIYRQGQKKEILTSPQFLLGENILPQFRLDLAIVW